MNQKKTTKKKPTRRRPKDDRSKAVPEYTAGGIVYRVVEGRADFLLMQDHKNRWTIPKGHVESGETLEQTALREITEETGLSQLAIRGKLDKVHFFYRREGELIFMTNFIFLVEALAPDEPLVLEDTEWVTDMQWFGAREAVEAIEYKGTKVLLEVAIKKVEELGINV